APPPPPVPGRPGPPAARSWQASRPPTGRRRARPRSTDATVHPHRPPAFDTDRPGSAGRHRPCSPRPWPAASVDGGTRPRKRPGVPLGWQAQVAARAGGWERSTVGGGEGRQGRVEGQPDVRHEVGDGVVRPGGGAVVGDAVEHEVDGVRERWLTQRGRLPVPRGPDGATTASPRATRTPRERGRPVRGWRSATGRWPR